MRLSLAKESRFPNMSADNYKVTSNPDVTYNCIAHAAGENDAWWWPAVGAQGVFWPPDVEVEETVECFVSAYGSLGYEQCDSESLENGYEKVALYVDQDGDPTHAARQLASGAWTSKLGEWEDIEHQSLSVLEDPSGAGLAYGKVALIMRRRAQ